MCSGIHRSRKLQGASPWPTRSNQPWRLGQDLIRKNGGRAHLNVLCQSDDIYYHTRSLFGLDRGNTNPTRMSGLRIMIRWTESRIVSSAFQRNAKFIIHIYIYIACARRDATKVSKTCIQNKKWKRRLGVSRVSWWWRKTLGNRTRRQQMDQAYVMKLFTLFIPY